LHFPLKSAASTGTIVSVGKNAKLIPVMVMRAPLVMLPYVGVSDDTSIATYIRQYERL
jgi:hypothetical protein